MISSLSQRSLNSVWHPCTQMKRAQMIPPLPMVKGQGPWLWDEQGHRYFDAISSWWVNLFGHADTEINAALKSQLDTLEHVMLAGCTHEPAVRLAELLEERTGGVLGHAFYGSDGASAIEIALKMSFHAWRNQGLANKTEFVCVQHGYHGETLGALSVTDVALFRDAYDPLLMRSHQIQSPDARRAMPGQSASDVAMGALKDLQQILEARQGRVSAVLIEPLVQCAAGMAMHDASFVSGVRDLCTKYQAHLIADEIAVGCGRTGTFFASEQSMDQSKPLAGQWPDFLTLSKGITGGYLPLSIVLTREEIFQSFWDDQLARGFLHSHSYTGNPLACRAAQTVLERFARDDVLSQNARVTQGISEQWQVFKQDERLEHVRQQGMIWALDVKPPYAGEDFAGRFHLAGREHELLIRPIGRTVYVMPAYGLPAEMYLELADRVSQTLTVTLAQTGSVGTSPTNSAPVAL